MLPENRSFIIRGDDGEEYGPVDMDALREWVLENRAGLGTVVRQDEPGALWQPWQYYPELVALLAEAHATSPVPGQPGLVIAPMRKRIMAWMLDMILVSFLASPICYMLLLAYTPFSNEQLVFALFNPQDPASQPILHIALIGNLVTYGMMALYMAGFHAAHGKTPAKAILRIRVVDQNGGKPRFVKCLLRGLGLVISLSQPFFGIPIAYAFFNPQRRAFHDFVAGTYVVEA